MNSENETASAPVSVSVSPSASITTTETVTLANYVKEERPVGRKAAKRAPDADFIAKKHFENAKIIAPRLKKKAELEEEKNAMNDFPLLHEERSKTTDRKQNTLV